MAAYHKHLNEVASLNSVDSLFRDCLQCPTIISPSPEAECDYLEPLDFLPITKERRDDLNARLLAKESKTSDENAGLVVKPMTAQQLTTTQDLTPTSISTTDALMSTRKSLLSLDDLPKTPFRCNYLRDLQDPQVNSEEVRCPLHPVKSALNYGGSQKSKCKGQALPDIKKQTQQQTFIRVLDSKPPPLLFQKVSLRDDQKTKIMKKPKSAASCTYRSFKADDT